MLKIKPIRLLQAYGEGYVQVQKKEVQDLEQQRDELIETLIVECIYMDTLGGDNLTLKQELKYTKWVGMIEKAYKMEWEDIKEQSK